MTESSFREGFTKPEEARGFTLIELMIVVTISLIIGAFAVPGFIQTMRNFRISGDARDIGSEILLTKMRAASNFTATREYFDSSQGIFVSQLWCRDISSLCSAGDINTWKNSNVGGPQRLSSGVSFGVANQTSEPTGGPITQAGPCRPGDSAAGWAPGGGADISNTLCVIFNSRGFPVDNSGTAIGTDAVYLDNANAVYGLTVSITGLTAIWRHDEADALAANWVRH